MSREQAHPESPSKHDLLCCPFDLSIPLGAGYPSALLAREAGYPSALLARGAGYPSALLAREAGYPSALLAREAGYPSALLAREAGYPSALLAREAGLKIHFVEVYAPCTRTFLMTRENS
nr:hypothetical protein [Deltaproteobacteria bacterium]